MNFGTANDAHLVLGSSQTGAQTRKISIDFKNYENTVMYNVDDNWSMAQITCYDNFN